MRALTVFLLFIAYALGVRWYYVCQIKKMCQPQTPAQITAPVDVRDKNLRLLSGDTVLLQGYDQFAFAPGQAQPRLNHNNEIFLDSVAAILQRIPSRKLIITGFYAPQEMNQSYGFFENFGTARADALRRLLMQRGVEESRISLDHDLSNDSLLRTPAEFSVFYDATARPDAYEKVQFSFTNMTFSDANFAFGSAEFRPGAAFTAYADSVKTYLSLNPDKKLTIIGHTDNVGSDKFNNDLGLRRAKSARDYFTKLGVTAPIEVQTQGKHKPVATNTTPEGRQKNRRVNFVIE